MGLFGSKPKAENTNTPVQNETQEVPVEIPGIKIAVSNFEKQDIKLLILGPGESGKSTYWRQLRCIYTGGLSQKEKKALIPPIRMNLIKDIKIIVNNASVLGYEISSSLASEIETIENLEISDDELTPEIAGYISAVWADPSSKTIYEQIHSCSLSDHSAFFLDSAERIADPNYIPTEEDVLKSRIMTTGVNNIKFDINGRKVLLVDVGGQRCERTKWHNVFDEVNAIIFVISLADFDQTMFESQEERRTLDSIELFKATINSARFTGVPIYLILNKEDELRRKLKLYPEQFKIAYPTFEGSLDDVDAVIKHIENEYISRANERKPEAPIKSFATCAVDPAKLEKSFIEVAENVISIKLN